MDKIILVQYDYDDDTDEDDADPEIWVIVNKNGKLVEGTLDETDQMF